MKSVTIDGVKYEVREDLGMRPDIGMRAILVGSGLLDDAKVAVKDGRKWRFWTPQDRLSRLDSTRNPNRREGH